MNLANGDLQLTPENAPGVIFDTYAAKQQLAFQRCDSCEHAIFPPRVLCNACGSAELTWTESSGHGTIYSQSTISPRNAEPYTVALIDVAEGFRLMSNVIVAEGETSKIGDDVVVSFREQDDAFVPVFTVKGDHNA